MLLILHFHLCSDDDVLVGAAGGVAGMERRVYLTVIPFYCFYLNKSLSLDYSLNISKQFFTKTGGKLKKHQVSVKTTLWMEESHFSSRHHNRGKMLKRKTVTQTLYGFVSAPWDLGIKNLFALKVTRC